MFKETKRRVLNHKQTNRKVSCKVVVPSDTESEKFCEFIWLCAAKRTGAADLTGLPTENVGHDISAPDCSNGSCAWMRMKMSQNFSKKNILADSNKCEIGTPEGIWRYSLSFQNILWLKLGLFNSRTLTVKKWFFYST